MLEVSEYTQKIENLKVRIKNCFKENGLPEKFEFEQNDMIKIAFIGQYSAGKSTILKMLTQREDIEIGASITTPKVHPYIWNGLYVVDTPGIHTVERPDHDEITYQEIVSADILVFVVTNELFDSYIADHFRKLAIDMDKGKEMILVINKMQRADLGNCLEQQEIIKNDLRKVLTPLTPEQLNICFLDAESYLDALTIREEEPEIYEELIDRSGYNQFQETLDSFVKKHELMARTTTSVYQLENIVQKAIKYVEPKAEDEDLDALEDNYLSQRQLLSEGKWNITQSIKNIFDSASSEIRKLGMRASNYIEEGCNQEEVEERISEEIEQASNVIEKCQHDAITKLELMLNDLGQSIDNLENREFTVTLSNRLSGKFNSLPPGVKNMLTQATTGLGKMSTKVIQNSIAAEAEGGLKLVNFSKSNVHEVVLNLGHKFGYKFKPWQAVKITKGVAIGGQVLSALGVVLSVGMQIKEDKDEEDIRKSLQKNRQSIRKNFNEAADGLSEQGKIFIKENVDEVLQPAIDGLNSNIAELRSTKKSASKAFNDLQKLQRECTNLVKEIHAFG